MEMLRGLGIWEKECESPCVFGCGCVKCAGFFPFFFLFSDFNQEQMSEQADELETSETTVRTEV